MARILSISVPEDLYDTLRKNKEISVSAVCQKALKVSVASGDELARHGAERLKRERWARWEVLVERCFIAGGAWAARTASVEELEFLFEPPGKRATEITPKTKRRFKVMRENGLKNAGVFANETSDFLPDECLADDTDNEFTRAFAEGAGDMWDRIKTLLGR